jgi:cell wall assembly regulator SMI1
VSSDVLKSAIARATRAGIVLRPPASGDALAKLEQLTKLRLPEDFRAFYSAHDGADGIGVANQEDLLSVSEIETSWQLLHDIWSPHKQDRGREVDAGMAQVLWHAAWIPFTHDGGGSYLCVDLAPDESAGGRVGQVIQLWHSDPSRQLVTKSFAHWLADVEWTP